MTKLFSRSIVLLFVSVLILLPIDPVKADNLGQNQNFFVDNYYDAQKRVSVTATLMTVSGHAYGYVENSFWNNLNKSSKELVFDHVGKILSGFDNRIYPIETQIFGSEPNPGIDNDPKITILFTPLIENAGGYFNSADCYYVSADNSNSNQREMFYLNVNLITDETRMESFLAHEFQHLISFNQKELLRRISDDIWLNESRSEYALTILGYNDAYSDSNLQKRIQLFTANPSDSLTEWKNLTPDYGQIALFGEYLNEHWPQVMISALKSDYAGILSLNYALSKNGFTEDFTAVFRDWMIANLLNNSTIDAKYGYTKPELVNFKITPTKTLINLSDSVTFAISDSFKDWQAHWYDISNFTPGQNPVLKINFSSSSITSFQISYLIFRTDGTVEAKIFNPSFKNSALYLDGIGSNLVQVVLMPFKKDKLTGFGSNEVAVDFAFTVDRIETMPDIIPPEEPSKIIKPADFGLHEGDFIRATGDIDIYIINDYGYKRLVLNPEICLMYGHLGARGCFSAVKIVSPVIRNAFKNSWYLTNGETQDGKVYKLEPTGEDTADIHWLNISGAQFLTQGGDFNSVFVINTNEQKSYSVSPMLSRL